MHSGAFFTGRYENLLARAGIAQPEIDARIRQTFDTMFHDPQERIYHPMGDDMGYMVDTGNNDARTEGMSYGMMMCVQLNEKDIFDRLWRFSKRFMWHADGKYAGYFAWSVQLDGTRNAQGPAPDGEEYYAMALLFAAKRWGDGAPPLDYSVQARDILRHCVHQDEIVPGGDPMWDRDNHLIKFIPETPFSDPSYHLPHFYELFSLYADEADRPFWRRAAESSRDYLVKACHPVTGMAPEYAHYDGSPETTREHGNFYSDAYRVAMNIGLDAAWFGRRDSLTQIGDALQRFFAENTTLGHYKEYRIDGTPLARDALHPTAIIATTAAASLAAGGPYAEQWVLDFWNTPLRTGGRRYYDNCLYLFCLLMLAGQYTMFLDA